MSWDAIAAPGTDPGLLARVVHRVRSADVGTAALLRDALARPGGDEPQPVLSRLAGPVQLDLDDAAAVRGAWSRRGVLVALPGDPHYPQRLLGGWPDPGVPLLYAHRGDPLAVDRGATVAIVGARRATGYGRGIAAWLAEACAESGVHVVSGGAVGIDAAAHGAAVAGGTTVVLGCGHDVDYPRPHTAPGGLFARVIEAGGAVVSEHLPDTPPHPGVVRTRNRIVAALADAIVVVEGSARSGSLLTANAAADRGIPVLAVPGDVRAPGSAAPHRLLADGAWPCTSPDDLLAALGRGEATGTAVKGSDSDGRPGTAGPSVLPSEVRGVLEARWPRPIRVDDLAEASGVPAATLLAAVTRARVAGEAVEDADGVRLSRAP